MVSFQSKNKTHSTEKIKPKGFVSPFLLFLSLLLMGFETILDCLGANEPDQAGSIETHFSTAKKNASL